METIAADFDSGEEWDAAYTRLRDYLRALHITNVEQRDEIVRRILACAASRVMEHPETPPTALVMQEMRAAIERWFEQIQPLPERAAIAGCLTLLATNVPEQWPAAFLGEKIPADLQGALQERRMQAVPALQVSSMVPDPFENPLPGTVPLRNALTKLAQSLAARVAKKPAPVPAEAPKPPAVLPH